MGTFSKMKLDCRLSFNGVLREKVANRLGKISFLINFLGFIVRGNFQNSQERCQLQDNIIPQIQIVQSKDHISIT
jgi:hypothetical protein